MIGSSEGLKEDRSSCLEFLRSLEQRGLGVTQLFIGDKCLGLFGSSKRGIPGFQVCAKHLYQNVFSLTPRSKMKKVWQQCQETIRAQEDKTAVKQKTALIVTKLSR